MEKEENNLQEDYELKDLILIFQDKNWHSWEEAINWLSAKERVDGIDEGKIIFMINDFSLLRSGGVVFTADPLEIYNLARGLTGGEIYEDDV